MAKGKLAPYHIEKGLTISPGKGFLLHLEKMPPMEIHSTTIRLVSPTMRGPKQ